MVNDIILQQETNNTNTMIVNKMGPIYQEEYDKDPIYLYLGTSMEFLVLFPLLTVYLRQTSTMLKEKEKKIRETMSIMGMKMRTYYFTWFIRYFLTYLIINLVATGIFVSAFKNIGYFYPFLICLLFHTLLIVLSFFVQIFVTRSKIGIVFALLFFILQYIVIFIVSNNANVTFKIYRAVSIVPHVAFSLAFKEMVYAESVKQGVTFSKLINSYTLNTAVVSIFLNIVFWTLLFMYLDKVFPNEFGAKKHPCFCFGCLFKKKNHSRQKDYIESE